MLSDLECFFVCLDSCCKTALPSSPTSDSCAYNQLTQKYKHKTQNTFFIRIITIKILLKH